MAIIPGEIAGNQLTGLDTWANAPHAITYFHRHCAGQGIKLNHYFTTSLNILGQTLPTWQESSTANMEPSVAN